MLFVKAQMPLPFELRDDFRLESFVRGANVELCEQLLALGVASESAEALWLHGPSGAGKSHLLQALVAELGARDVAAAYLPAHQIPLEHVGGMLEGSQRYQVLVVDDLDRWLGEVHAETELVKIYQERRHTRQHLVLAATKAPAEYQMALPDWQSRAQSAQVFRLNELADEGKLQVLVRRAERLGLTLGEPEGQYLLRHGPRALPAMLSVLARADQLALAEQRRLSVPLLKRVLEIELRPPGSMA